MAVRQFEGNLGKELTLRELQAGPVRVADVLRLEAELREIFKHISHADPYLLGQDGNFDANAIPITTPSAVDVEFAIAHSLGRIPVGCQPVLPTRTGCSYVSSLYCTRAPDTQYLYLAVRATHDTARVGSVRVW